jgi:hypothetical protein
MEGEAANSKGRLQDISKRSTGTPVLQGRAETMWEANYFCIVMQVEALGLYSGVV